MVYSHVFAAFGMVGYFVIRSGIKYEVRLVYSHVFAASEVCLIFLSLSAPYALLSNLTY